MTITLQRIFEESTRLLQVFRARPATKHSIGKVLEEVVELNDALNKLDDHPQNFILMGDAAKETCDIIVSAINAYYGRGGTIEALEIAMESTFDKNRAKNEDNYLWDGKSIKKRPIAQESAE